MKNRLAEFDFIKGVMICLMVFGHISYLGTLQEEF
jgi:fucose 4-O-acetylase-like acetyltransferase